MNGYLLLPLNGYRYTIMLWILTKLESNYSNLCCDSSKCFLISVDVMPLSMWTNMLLVEYCHHIIPYENIFNLQLRHYPPSIVKKLPSIQLSSLSLLLLVFKVLICQNKCCFPFEIIVLGFCSTLPTITVHAYIIFCCQLMYAICFYFPVRIGKSLAAAQRWPSAGQMACLRDPQFFWGAVWIIFMWKRGLIATLLVI